MNAEHSHYFSDCPADPSVYAPSSVTIAGKTGQVLTAPGVFSSGHLDHGTATLLRKAPQPPASGTFLDIGCGWGPIAMHLGLIAPQSVVWAVDVNARARDLTRRNCAAWQVSNVTCVSPDEVPDDVRFDLIWSNPPIRVGRAVTQEILMTWLPRLAPGGQAYLVIQRNLGSDSICAWLKQELPSGWSADKLGSSKGFRVLEVTAASQP